MIDRLISYEQIAELFNIPLFYAKKLLVKGYFGRVLENPGVAGHSIKESALRAFLLRHKRSDVLALLDTQQADLQAAEAARQALAAARKARRRTSGRPTRAD